jgi:hypothetical protein
MALASPGYVVRDLIRPATVPPLYKTAPCPRPAQRPVAPWPAPSGLRPQSGSRRSAGRGRPDPPRWHLALAGARSQPDMLTVGAVPRRSGEGAGLSRPRGDVVDAACVREGRRRLGGHFLPSSRPVG